MVNGSGDTRDGFTSSSCHARSACPLNTRALRVPRVSNRMVLSRPPARLASRVYCFRCLDTNHLPLGMPPECREVPMKSKEYQALASPGAPGS